MIWELSFRGRRRSTIEMARCVPVICESTDAVSLAAKASRGELRAGEDVRDRRATAEVRRVVDGSDHDFLVGQASSPCTCLDWR